MPDYRDKHAREVVFSSRERASMARKITASILVNYSRKDILKMYFLLENWHDITFTRSPVRLEWLDRDLPEGLQKIIGEKYPQKAKSEDEESA